MTPSPTDGSTTDPAASNLTPEEQTGRQLYGHTPAEASSELYPIEASINRTLVENLERLSDRTDLSREQQATERRAYIALLRKSGLHEDVELAKDFHSAQTAMRMHQAVPGSDEDARAADREATITATREAGRQKFGAADFDALMARLRKFDQAFPDLRVNEVLTATSGEAQQRLLFRFFDHLQRLNYR
jgi:hypothetical protein